MNPADIGKHIVKARKELGYTQKQLADKLSVSDKTISKWERGIGCPDISLLLPLCTELQIEVSELLGKEKESLEIKDKEQRKLHQFGEYATMKIKENRARIAYFTAIGITVLCCLAIFICLLTEYAINDSFTWSIIATASICYGWIILVIVLLAKTHKIEKTLLAASILIFPFLYVLSIKIPTLDLFALAYPIAVGSLIFVGCAYLILKKMNINYYFRFSIIVILSLFLSIFINNLQGEIRYVIIQVISNTASAVLLLVAGVFWELRKKKKV